MKKILRFLYCCYQILVLPILVFNTIMCSVITILFFPFKNTEPIHQVQMWWCKLFFYWLFLPVTIDGAENLKKGQSYVFVANHSSMFDVFLIYGWLPVIYKWMMKAELRKMPFVGTACKAAGHVFVDRSSPKAAMKSVEEVKRTLRNGICTVIFPEGTRSADGQLGRFRRGAFQIALDLNLPIVPLSLSGCYEVMNRNEIFAHRHPVHMHIGKPIDLTELKKKLEAEHPAEAQFDEAHHNEAIMNYVREQVAAGMLTRER